MRALLTAGARAGLISPGLLDPECAEGAATAEVVTRTSPQGLRLLAQGSSASVWIGAALLAMFLVEIEISETPPLALLIGTGGLAAAGWLVRQPLSLLTVQLAWVGAIGGQVLWMTGAAELTSSHATLASLSLGLQVATLLLIPNLALGCAAVLVGVVSLYSLVDALNVEDVWIGPMTLGLGAATVGLWLGEASLAGGALRRLWQPLAYTLPFALGGSLALLMASSETLLPWTIGFVALAAVVIVRAGSEQAALAGAPRYVALAGLALLAALAPEAPGLAAGVMLLVLSHLRRNAGLQALALVTIGGFLFLWYYDMQTTLLTKSLAGIGNGVALLLGAALLRRWTGKARETEAHSARRRSTAPWGLAGALLLAVGLPGVQVALKEQVLRDGQTVLLRLRPVDPRSLMQGDYMVLRYAIADEAVQGREPPRSGAIVVRVGGERVAEFVRVDSGGPLASDEVRLRYRLRGGELRLGAESFFFAEGAAERYASAAFGELRVDESGESVLVGLRDAERVRLGAPLHPVGGR